MTPTLRRGPTSRRATTGGRSVRTARTLRGAPVLSADILEQQGFEIIGKHPRFPRYRKDLNSAASLFSDFEADTHALLNNSAPLSTVLGGQWA